MCLHCMASHFSTDNCLAGATSGWLWDFTQLKVSQQRWKGASMLYHKIMAIMSSYYIMSMVISKPCHCSLARANKWP